MKTTAIHLFLSVVVGVLIVGGAYYTMETITPETSAVKPSTLTSVSINNEQYTSLAPTVHQAKPYKKTTVNTISSTSTKTTAVPLYTHSQQAKQHAHSTPVIAHSHAAQTKTTQPTQQQAIAMVSQHSGVAMPFSAMAPRVIAASGDLQPFQNQAPRKAPPTTGGQDPENTDIIIPQPLPDGSIFLLLLIIGYAVLSRSIRRSNA